MMMSSTMVLEEVFLLCYDYFRVCLFSLQGIQGPTGTPGDPGDAGPTGLPVSCYRNDLL